MSSCSIKRACLRVGERIPEIQQRLFTTPSEKHWSYVKVQHHHGVCTTVSSLRSEYSCGVGDLRDLTTLVDWVASINFDTIALLPINWPLESNPYISMSSMLIDPMLLSLREIPGLDTSHDIVKRLIMKLKQLDAADRINWDEIRLTKLELLWVHFMQPQQQEFLRTKLFQNFVKENEDWLIPHAKFAATWMKQRQQSWEAWSDTISQEEDIKFQQYLQWLLHHQLQIVTNYAREKGVLLMLDLPFSFPKNSADVWDNQNLFELDFILHRPPAASAPFGKDLHVVPWRWEEESQVLQNFERRIQLFGKYFDILRFDFVEGFFREWAKKSDTKVKDRGMYLGNYDEKEACLAATRRLSRLVNASPALLAGDTMKNVPIEFRCTLQDLGICSTNDIRSLRDWNKGGEFVPTCDYNTDSVATAVAAKDAPLDYWIQHNPLEFEAYCACKGWNFSEVSTLSRDQRMAILHDIHHAASLFHINMLNDYLMLDPSLTFGDPNYEHIEATIPRDKDKPYSYRMKPTLEKVITSKAMHEAIMELLKSQEDDEMTYW